MRNARTLTLGRGGDECRRDGEHANEEEERAVHVVRVCVLNYYFLLSQPCKRPNDASKFKMADKIEPAALDSDIHQLASFGLLDGVFLPSVTRAVGP